MHSGPTWIIEGAAEGKGLGHRFLRHIERNPVLLFLIPADSPNHKKEFEILAKELEHYNPELLHKQFVMAISKADLLDEELTKEIEKELPGNIPHLFISSVMGKGLTELKDLLWKTSMSNHPFECIIMLENLPHAAIAKIKVRLSLQKFASMRKLFATAFLFLVIVSKSLADEGMWLPLLLGQQVYNDMVKKGLKLTKEQLYSINKASLKDAIVIFGSGCTGEMVSTEGLLLQTIIVAIMSLLRRVR